MCLGLVGQQEALQSAVHEVLASCDCDEDRQIILQQFTVLKTRLASVRNTVEHKVAVHDILREHAQVRSATRDTIAHLQKRLKDELSAEAVSGFKSDLDIVRSNLMNLVARHPEMEALFVEAGITVRDPGTERVMDVKDDVKKLLSHIENDEKKLKLCSEIIDLSSLLSEVSNNLDTIDVVYLDDVDAFRTAVKVSYLHIFKIVPFVTNSNSC